MITQEDIVQRLKETGIPYSHLEFVDTKATPAPDPPYMCYIYSEDSVGPDDSPSMLISVDIGIELYTSKIRNEELENIIENKVVYDTEYHKEIAVVPQENLIQTSYDISIKFKKGGHTKCQKKIGL